MSIATKSGDGGTTALIGGTRVSKADVRVEAYGTVDELGSFLGFARSICSDAEVAGWTEEIQRTLFRVGSALGTPEESRRGAAPALTAEDVDRLTGLVDKIEAVEGIVGDWALPGAHRESAAFEMARTVCRRAARCAGRLREEARTVGEEAVAYLNRLSDLIWLFGRLLEVRAGVSSRIRGENEPGGSWSRAW